MPHLQLVLGHVDDFLEAVRSLRTSKATKGKLYRIHIYTLVLFPPPTSFAAFACHPVCLASECRLVWVNNCAHDPRERTTGVRNSWAHAAVNAYVTQLLSSAKHGHLHVEVIDALGVTWPREEASPDGVHYLRHRFRKPAHDPILNDKGQRVRDGLGFTAPPPGCANGTAAECIGDAGWVVALALHAQLVQDESVVLR